MDIVTTALMLNLIIVTINDPRSALTEQEKKKCTKNITTVLKQLIHESDTPQSIPQELSCQNIPKRCYRKPCKPLRNKN